MSNELNIYGSKPKGVTLASVTSAMATTRQAQEVQAMVIMARQFPRDRSLSLDRILEDCTRPTLAEAATYEYPRGGSKVTGPSIRLAECIAQNWGNIDYGFVELEKRENESTIMAYAWDLETNTRQSKVFTVKHQRDVQNGSKPVTSERDIYEVVANQASRRVRTCILSLIPGDVIDVALKQCDATLASQNQGAPTEELVAKLLGAFQAEFEITPDMVAGYIGKNIEAFTDKDLTHLRRVYTSLKEGIVGSDYFTTKMRNSVKQPETAPDAISAPAGAGDTAPAAQNAQDSEYGGPSDELPFEFGLDSV